MANEEDAVLSLSDSGAESEFIGFVPEVVTLCNFFTPHVNEADKTGNTSKSKKKKNQVCMSNKKRRLTKSLFCLKLAMASLYRFREMPVVNEHLSPVIS
jgi:hypothetical protein